MVEQRTGNAEVTGSNPVEALIFFRLFLFNCLNWKIYCDDHSSLSLFIFLCVKYLLVRVSGLNKNPTIYFGNGLLDLLISSFLDLRFP